MTIPIPLQEALRDSVTSGSFIDTKFWLFSKRRSAPGHVGVPKALFVNEHVAKRVPHLVAILEECKTRENLRTRFPASKKPYTINYDYEDDSDLEEDSDGDVSDDEPEVPPQVATEESGNHLPEPVAIENSDTNSSRFSDILSVSDVDSLLSESPDAKDGTEAAHVGKVVVIEDVAFVTFQALLRYLYTNEIEFAPWGSSERRKARALETASDSYGIPKPSPKSIYRIADKYEIPELKELALGQIQRDLSKCNIAEELFSKYTSWYPEIRELELRELARVLLSSNSSPTSQSLKEKIKSYTNGKLPHTKHVISALYNLMESDESIEETPLPAVASPNHDAVGGDWTGLKKALTSSLTSGTFLDTQFYAMESRSPTGLTRVRPIYFCSTVGGDFTPKLLTVSSKFKPGKVPPRSEDGYDSDVDDEEPGQERSTECYPSSKCIRENPTPPDMPLDPALLLDSGVAKNWSAICLYVYTGMIKFTTGSHHRKNGCREDGTKLPQDPEELGIPTPDVITIESCSPKSIYCLADKVGLTRLCTTAFKMIQSQLDENNIVQELFSSFAAQYTDVREMEHELFQSKLKPLVDRALLSDIIESSSTGEHPHRAAAMELILERSIQERLERKLTKVKNSEQPNPAPQPEGSSETPITPIQKVKPLAPPPASQPPPRQSSGFRLASLLEGFGEPQDLSTSSKPAGKFKAVRLEEPPADIKANPLSSDVVVELVCGGCRVKRPISRLWSKTHCPSCPTFSDIMRCARCETIRTENVKACTSCHGEFKQ